MLLQLSTRPCYSKKIMKNLHEIILPVLNDIQAGKKTIEVSELWGAAKALFLFGLKRKLDCPVIVITASEDTAEALLDDLNFFRQKAPRNEAESSALKIHVFPTWDVLPFEADSPDSRTVGERMRFLYDLVSGDPGIFVVPVQSLIQKLPPWNLFIDSVKTITTTTQLNPDSLVASLVATGYESSSLVTRVGEFSKRGGIVDFFHHYMSSPCALNFLVILWNRYAHLIPNRNARPKRSVNP